MTGRERMRLLDRALARHVVVEAPGAAKQTSRSRRRLARRFALKHALQHLRSAWALIREAV